MDEGCFSQQGHLGCEERPVLQTQRAQRTAPVCPCSQPGPGDPERADGFKSCLNLQQQLMRSEMTQIIQTTDTAAFGQFSTVYRGAQAGQCSLLFHSSCCLCLREYCEVPPWGRRQAQSQLPCYVLGRSGLRTRQHQLQSAEGRSLKEHTS